MPLKANGMSPCQLVPVPGPYPELLYREESHSREEKKLHSMERSALPGGAPKRDLHAAEMFIVNCCRQRAPRPLPPFAPPAASAPAPPSAPAPRLGAEMSTAQSADVYIESHFGCQTARRGRGKSGEASRLMKSANNKIAMHFSMYLFKCKCLSSTFSQRAPLIVPVASTLRPANPVWIPSCLPGWLPANLPNICPSHIRSCCRSTSGMGYAPEWHCAQMKCMAGNLSIWGPNK